jgi:hypothetical protein
VGRPVARVKLAGERFSHAAESRRDGGHRTRTPRRLAAPTAAAGRLDLCRPGDSAHFKSPDRAAFARSDDGPPNRSLVPPAATGERGPARGPRYCNFTNVAPGVGLWSRLEPGPEAAAEATQQVFEQLVHDYPGDPGADGRPPPAFFTIGRSCHLCFLLPF